MGVTIKSKFMPYSSQQTQAILEHAEVSLPLADTAVQPYSTLEQDDGQTTTSETIGGQTIATSGDTVYVIRPGYSIKHICQTQNHRTYIIGINSSTKTILKESDYGEVNWTNNTANDVTVQVGCLEVGDIYTVKIFSAGFVDAVSELKESVADKYTKPGSGIPATDMAEGVKTSLVKADNALQNVTEEEFNAIFYPE